jgi:hypothetical protein
MLDKFKTSAGELEIVPAEVLSVNFSDSNPTLVNTIRVKVLDRQTAASTDTSLNSLIARPLSSLVKRIPLVHEVVLLIKAPSAYTNGIRVDNDNYYIDVVGLASNLNHNSLPKVSKVNVLGTTKTNSTSYSNSQTGNVKVNTTTDSTLDNNFTENSLVKALQPYVGDVLLEGRFGNSIRFSSTQKNTSLFSKIPRWSQGNTGDPILIIRNTRQSTNTNRQNDFTTEDFNLDDSVIALTSGQQLEFAPNTTVDVALKSEGLNTWQKDKWGKIPNALISSGRVTVNSTAKEVSVFGKDGISLASDNSVTVDSSKNIVFNGSEIKLGNNATEQLVLGNQLVTWLNNLITTLSTLTVTTAAGPSAPLITSPQWAAIQSLQGQLNTLLSLNVKVAKTLSTTATSGKSSPFFKNSGNPDYSVSEQRKQSLTQERDAIIDKENTLGTLSVPDRERKQLIERILLYQSELNSEIPKPS